MKRIVRIVAFFLVAVLVTGCGKKTPKKSKPVTVEPTEQVTETPTPLPKKEKSVSFPVSYKDGWICQGMIGLDETGAETVAIGDGANTFAGRITEYRVENSGHKELFRIVSAGKETETEYTLQIGAYERRLAVVSKENPTVELFRYPERLVIRQNGTTILMISADSEAMTISADENRDVWAFRFPVKNGTVSETDATGLLHLGEDTLTERIHSLKDLYDGSYLSGIEEKIRKAEAPKEHDGEYVQVTKKRVIENGTRSQEYNAIYQSNTVIVDRRNGSGNVTEYEFRELSNGISSVAYFSTPMNDGREDFLFDVELLDEFRSKEYEREEAEERKAAELKDACIPFRIIPTESGFIERGIKKTGETQQDYIRVCLCDSFVDGNVYGFYEGGEAVSVFAEGLSGADGRLYAKGEIVREDRAVRSLHEFSYDEYGVLIKETKPGYTASYEYAFSDFAYGGADDTIRHEWQKLMPYLEDYPVESR